MAFTGDLEHLHIVDIIQLIHTTRKSGVFSVKGDKGESKVVFSSGYIVAANYVNNNVRIGTVLVKTNAIAIDDLHQAMRAMKDAGVSRKPLIATLIQMGRLKREDALRGLKKQIEMTIVELMGWTKGAFTFDTNTIAVSAEAGQVVGGMEQDFGVDAQMVLMDALRIFDERERDRLAGKEPPSYEELYADVLPSENALETEVIETHSTVTADDLGLADIDLLEKRIPVPVSEVEIFDPFEIHRRNIQEILAGSSSEEQEAFVSFLRRSLNRKASSDAAAKQAGKAIVIYSGDKLVRHSVMAICKNEGIIVFASEDEKDLDRVISQCLFSMRMPIVVFDSPEKTEGAFSVEQIENLRRLVRKKYPAVPVLQFASSREDIFILRSYDDGVRAVLPKPLKEARRETYIQDTIQFLDTFNSYIKGFQCRYDDNDTYKKLKEGLMSFRALSSPSEAALVILTAVSEMFERAVMLLVRSSELIGERAIGVTSEKSIGPTQADRLKISLSKPSVFLDVVEKGRSYFGESGDETVTEFFQHIGKPLSPVVLLLPLVSDQKVVAVIYGDFGAKEASPVQFEILEILAQQTSIVLENAMLRRQASTTA